MKACSLVVRLVTIPCSIPRSLEGKQRNLNSLSLPIRGPERSLSPYAHGASKLVLDTKDQP